MASSPMQTARRNGDTIRKAAQIVLAREQGDLDVIDRKVFNYLYSSVQCDVRPGEAVLHRVPVSDVLDYLGHSSTSRLHDSLARLSSVNVLIDYVDEDKVEHSARARYLSYDMAKTVDGWIHFALDPILVEFMANPAVFAIFSRSLAGRFHSNYAAKLFEVMGLYVNRIHQAWTPTVDEFREFMRVDEGYSRFDNLRRRVVEAAVDEVNEIAPFHVEVEYVRTGKGGKVTGLRFTARRKGPQTLLDMRAVVDPLGRGRGRARDPNTPDMLDGRTDAERGFGDVGDKAMARAIDMVGGEGDVAVYLEEWRESMRGRVVRDSDRSFINWLDLKLAKARDVELGMVDDDTFSALLERWEGSK